MTNSASPHLLVFAKNPILGRVKTRLAKTVGHAEALNINERLLALNQELCQQVDWSKSIFYSDFIDTTDAWERQIVFKHLQLQTPNLGDRLQNAIQSKLTGEQSLLVIGTDCPRIEVKHLTETANLLASHDAVIGPATDGGFYLFGLNAWHDGIFKDINWSTDQVLIQLTDNLDRLNYTYTLLEPLTDIDHYEDWVSVDELLTTRSVRQ